MRRTTRECPRGMRSASPHTTHSKDDTSSVHRYAWKHGGEDRTESVRPPPRQRTHQGPPRVRPSMRSQTMRRATQENARPPYSNANITNTDNECAPHAETGSSLNGCGCRGMPIHHKGPGAEAPDLAIQGPKRWIPAARDPRHFTGRIFICFTLRSRASTDSARKFIGEMSHAALSAQRRPTHSLAHQHLIQANHDYYERRLGAAPTLVNSLPERLLPKLGLSLPTGF